MEKEYNRPLTPDYIVELFEGVKDCQSEEDWKQNKERFIELIKEFRDQPSQKTKEIVVEKGEETNKLMVMKELMEPLRDGFFEQVTDENADSARRMFGADQKIVATKNFKVKLIVDYED